MHWIGLAIQASQIKIIDLTPEIVVQSTNLTDFHKDLPTN